MELYLNFFVRKEITEATFFKILRLGIELGFKYRLGICFIYQWKYLCFLGYLKSLKHSFKPYITCYGYQLGDESGDEVGIRNFHTVVYYF